MGAAMDSLPCPHRQPVRVPERHHFDALVDARSPAEFELDHIPGSNNCLGAQQRRAAEIGTIYKNGLEAKRLGAVKALANLARHLRETFADKPGQLEAPGLLLAWRPAQRSMVPGCAGGLGRAAAGWRLQGLSAAM